VSKKIGRDLPSGFLGFALPLPPKATNEDPVGQRAARSERQIAIGITIDEMQGFFGPPKHLVDYTFKGRPASYRIYQTDEGGAFASFTFVDGVLIEFGGGGRTPLSLSHSERPDLTVQDPHPIPVELSHDEAIEALVVGATIIPQ